MITSLVRLNIGLVHKKKLAAVYREFTMLGQISQLDLSGRECIRVREGT